MSTRIKICCIQSIDEAQLAIEHGAHVLGLVGKMPSGPGPIEDDRIAEIAAWSSKSIETFLLTSELTANKIIAHHSRTGTSAIQLVDAVAISEYAIMRDALPGIHLVQVIHVIGMQSLDEALLVAPHVDTLLLDSGNPKSKIKELGGTGRTHNWEVSKQIVQQAEIPVYLAGGLNADNVCKAIQQVRPFGVDLCSGVRKDGILDQVKLQAFVRNIRAMTVG